MHNAKITAALHFEKIKLKNYLIDYLYWVFDCWIRAAL